MLRDIYSMCCLIIYLRCLKSNCAPWHQWLTSTASLGNHLIRSFLGSVLQKQMLNGYSAQGRSQDFWFGRGRLKFELTFSKQICFPCPAGSFIRGNIISYWKSKKRKPKPKRIMGFTSFGGLYFLFLFVGGAFKPLKPMPGYVPDNAPLGCDNLSKEVNRTNSLTVLRVHAAVIQIRLVIDV